MATIARPKHIDNLCASSSRREIHVFVKRNPGVRACVSGNGVVSRALGGAGHVTWQMPAVFVGVPVAVAVGTTAGSDEALGVGGLPPPLSLPLPEVSIGTGLALAGSLEGAGAGDTPPPPPPPFYIDTHKRREWSAVECLTNDVYTASRHPPRATATCTKPTAHVCVQRSRRCFVWR